AQKHWRQQFWQSFPRLLSLRWLRSRAHKNAIRLRHKLRTRGSKNALFPDRSTLKSNAGRNKRRSRNGSATPCRKSQGTTTCAAATTTDRAAATAETAALKAATTETTFIPPSPRTALRNSRGRGTLRCCFA